MEPAEFQAQFRPPAAGSAAEVLAKAAVMPDLGDLAEAAAERAAADARAAQREELLMANQAAGNPIAQVSRYQAELAEERDRVRDLESQLEAARSRVSRVAANLDHWSAEADAVRTAVARRSDNSGDLLGPAKAAHREFAAATRAAIEALEAGTPRRAPRPFAGHGNITRSEPPVECPECVEAGCTWEESVLIHHDADLARNPDPDHAERYQQVRAGGRDYVYDKQHREISRAGRAS